LLRQAVGAPQLNYRGVSYGTLLGATYANLFPNKVRAMVLDGNVDPVAWTNGGRRKRTFLSTSLRLGSDKASAKTLNAFLTLCGQASTEQCAFSAGSAAATRAKWATLLHRLRQQPVTIDGQTITYAGLVSGMGGVLYTSQAEPGFPAAFPGWTAFATVLQTLWTSSDPSAPVSAPEAAASSAPGTGLGFSVLSAGGPEQTYIWPEQALAVECSDSPNPRNPEVFRALDALSYARGRHRPVLVLGRRTLCELAGQSRHSLRRTLGPAHRQPRAGDREHLRPGHPLPGRGRHGR
jgi:pimeloyl-ACP methyl ester carboxylesterase